jgi:uncharacterized protein (TIGR04255 family)
MSVTYRNAPLVELVAELRWDPFGLLPPVYTAPGTSLLHASLAAPRAKDEEIFQKFGAIVSERGYTRMERLIPKGFVAAPARAVCKFLPADPSMSSPKFQIGMGVVTVNATPPYKSWADFYPTVRTGIQATLEAFDQAGVARPNFDTALVRYIDVFKEKLTGGRDLLSFMRDVFGIHLTLPQAIRRVATDESLILPQLALQIPLRTGLMTINIGQGIAGNDEGVLLDTTVVTPGNLGADLDRAMQALSDSRQIIHDVFRGLTATIHVAMEPVQ